MNRRRGSKSNDRRDTRTIAWLSITYWLEGLTGDQEVCGFNPRLGFKIRFSKIWAWWTSNDHLKKHWIFLFSLIAFNWLVNWVNSNSLVKARMIWCSSWNIYQRVYNGNIFHCIANDFRKRSHSEDDPNYNKKSIFWFDFGGFYFCFWWMCFCFCLTSVFPYELMVVSQPF